MEHKIAKGVFEEIRDRPYAWSTAPGKPSNNCYFKGIELLQRLGILGYAVRGCVGEPYLDERIPAQIRNLYPAQFPLTHFWVEVQLEHQWRTLDPSYDPPLSRGGLTVNEWDSDNTCFKITTRYSQEKAISYQQEWAEPEYARQYFEAIGPCASALNTWYQALRG